MVTPVRYQWRLGEFLAAWEAGAFDGRAELVDGEVWAVPIGDWHGDTAARVLRALPNDRFQVTTSSLPAGDSLPDPDCWVRRADATPHARLSSRLLRWLPTDVLLVVEVSDETVEHDLGEKALLYARASFARYWAVTRDGVYDHSDPGTAGYQRRLLYPPGAHIPVPYGDDISLPVDALLDARPTR